MKLAALLTLVLTLAACEGSDDSTADAGPGDGGAMNDGSAGDGAAGDGGAGMDGGGGMSGAIVVTGTVGGITDTLVCPVGGKYGNVTKTGEYSFNTLLSDGKCTSGMSSLLSVLNFPLMSATAVTGAADVIVQIGKSPGQMRTAKSAKTFSFVLDKYDAMAKTMKGTMSFTWDDGTASVAFDVQIN